MNKKIIGSIIGTLMAFNAVSDNHNDQRQQRTDNLPLSIKRSDISTLSSDQISKLRDALVTEIQRRENDPDHHSDNHH